MFDPAPFGVIATDASGRIDYVNPHQCTASALPSERFLGESFRSVIGAAPEAERLVACAEALEREGTPFEMTLPRYERRSDQSVLALSVRGYRYDGHNVLVTTVNDALSDSVNRYDQLFENANDGIIILSPECRYLAVNRAFAEIVGIPREELLGKTTEVLLPGRLAESKARVERIMREGKFGPYELRLETPRGERCVSLSAFALEEKGVPVGVMNIARDITEQKAVERQLARESAFVRLLKDVAVAANQAPTSDEALRSALEKVCGVTGWPVGHVYALDPKQGDLAPTNIWCVSDEQQFEPFRRATETCRMRPGVGLPGKVFAAAKPVWVVDPTGPEHPRSLPAAQCGLKSAFGFPIFAGHNVVAVLEFFSLTWVEPDPVLVDLVGTIGTQLGRAIERARAEQALQRSESYFKSVVDASLEPISLNSFPEGLYLDVNRAFEEIIGLSRAEVIGRRPIDLDLFVDREQMKKTLKDLAVSGAVHNVETQFRKKGGEVIETLFSATLIETGGRRAVLSFTRDISERKAVERELVRARDQAVQFAQLKSAFLATMSHEIRTPLNGVIGMAGLLSDTDLSGEQREYAETIRSCAETLLGLINDVLDFSKIESGKLAIEPIPFDLELAAQEVVELLAAKATEKKLDMILRCAPDTPTRVIGDPGRVRQVLTNLANNALKFTEVGEVVVDVSCDRRDEKTAWIRFRVQDSGIGIPLDKQQHVFERFTQADSSTTRKYGGTGLGLAISKQLVELMEGSMGLESEPGKGSTFWFVLPLALDLERADEPSIDHTDLRGLRVLIVDDNAVNRRVLKELLTRWGMNGEQVASGPQALGAMRAAAASGNPFQIALVDMNMPEMDGEMVGRAIKADTVLRPAVLVLLTSSGQRGDEQRLSEAGFAAYMTKPVRPSVLLDAMVSAWAKREQEAAAVRVGRHVEKAPGASSPKGDGPFAGVRVLVVEDNVVNQKVACLALTKLGCRVDSAANGQEGVEMIRTIPYDIVFMDCQMPIMDGYEAAREIRRTEKPGERRTIVAMTANAMEGDRERCLEAGMDDYVTKPVRREALEAALKKWTTPAEAPETAAEEPPADTELLENLKWMHEEGGDEFVADLVGGFLKKTPTLLAALADALAARNLPQVRPIVHELKGMSATLGATRLAHAIEEIEAKVAGESPEVSDLEAIRREFTRVESTLAEHVKTATPGAA